MNDRSFCDNPMEKRNSSEIKLNLVHFVSIFYGFGEKTTNFVQFSEESRWNDLSFHLKRFINLSDSIFQTRWICNSIRKYGDSVDADSTTQVFLQLEIQSFKYLVSFSNFHLTPTILSLVLDEFEYIVNSTFILYLDRISRTANDLVSDNFPCERIIQRWQSKSFECINQERVEKIVTYFSNVYFYIYSCWE